MNSKPTNQPPEGITPDNIEGHLNAFRDGYNAAMVGNPSGLQVKSIQEVMALDSFINAIRHNSPPSDTIKLLQEHFWAAVDAVQKAITPPSQPLGIDGRRRNEDISDKERLYWAAIASSARDGNIGFLMEHYVVTKVSESVSPQSSTSEEEKVEIIDGYTQLMIDRRSLPKDGQHVKFMTENEEWHEGYFVGGDDIFHVTDSKFFFKWHVQQWKAI